VHLKNAVTMPTQLFLLHFAEKQAFSEIENKIKGITGRSSLTGKT
jgi:hypothetical protein